MRKVWFGGVVLLSLLSHVSRLCTLSSFEATPTQDGIRGVDFNQAYTALLCCSSTMEQEVTVVLRKLMTTQLNVIQENNSFLQLGMGLFLVVLMVTLMLLLLVCRMAVSSGTWIHINLC